MAKHGKHWVREPDWRDSIASFLHCRACMHEAETTATEASPWTALGVAVAEGGHLVIWCQRCDRLVARIHNDDVAGWLRDGTSCEACEHDAVPPAPERRPS